MIDYQMYLFCFYEKLAVYNNTKTLTSLAQLHPLLLIPICSTSTITSNTSQNCNYIEIEYNVEWNKATFKTVFSHKEWIRDLRKKASNVWNVTNPFGLPEAWKDIVCSCTIQTSTCTCAANPGKDLWSSILIMITKRNTQGVVLNARSVAKPSQHMLD